MPTHSASPSSPASICLLRLSALGDVTHVLPVVHALRDACPGARLTWIVGKLEHRLLAGLPGVEFVVVDKRSRASVGAARRALRRRRFDVLLKLQLSFRATRLGWSIAADRRIGFDSIRSRELHGLGLTDRIAHVRGQHVLEALASFVVPLGLSALPPRWALPLDEDARAFARAHVAGTRPTLAITPCSSHAARNWRPERYAAVADHAAARGWQVIVCAGPSREERAFVDALLAAARAQILDLTGRDTLKRLAALLGASQLVLAPDTGPAHIANAMGTPVLGLYAATDPWRSGPYDSRALCVNRFPDAARRYARCEPEALRWGAKIETPGVMDLITVEAVIERFEGWRASGVSVAP